jgi:LysM repeat protein
MSGRRIRLLGSIIVVSLLYALLLLLAPQIVLLEAGASKRPELERFRVQLREVPDEAPRFVESTPAPAATRPGAVRDLLVRAGTEATPPAPLIAGEPVIEDLDQRLARERLAAAAPAFEETAADQSRVDARILEISREDARPDVKVARRLVRPSPDRILDAGAAPVLRTPRGEGSGLPLLRPLGTSLLEGDAGGIALPGTQGRLREDLPALGSALEPVAPPGLLPAESRIARSTLGEAAAAARAQSNYAFWDDLLDIRVDTWRMPEESIGYFRLRVLPREEAKIDPLPKHVTFVMDASSSIAPQKLNTTAKAVRAALDTLRPEDRFNIIVFRDTSTSFQPESVPATPQHVAAAGKFLQGIESRGATDVYKALQPVVQTAAPPGEPGIVIFLSDGRPTAGLRDGRTLINGLTADNALRNSIFAFGGGNTVNAPMMDLLAYRNKGESVIVSSIGEIGDGLARLMTQLRDPLLVDLRADFSRMDTAEIYPKVLPDFYRARPITLYGRFDPASDRELVLRLAGRAGANRKEVVFRANLKDAPQGEASIARNWAFQKSFYLAGEIARQGELPELTESLAQLGRRYGFATSYGQ